MTSCLFTNEQSHARPHARTPARTHARKHARTHTRSIASTHYAPAYTHHTHHTDARTRPHITHTRIIPRTHTHAHARARTHTHTYNWKSPAYINTELLPGLRVDLISISNHYCKSWSFVIDVASILPFSLLHVFADNPVEQQRVYTMLRLNRLIKTCQVIDDRSQTTTYITITITIYVIVFTLAARYITHYNGTRLSWRELCNILAFKYFNGINIIGWATLRIPFRFQWMLR